MDDRASPLSDGLDPPLTRHGLFDHQLRPKRVHCLCPLPLSYQSMRIQAELETVQNFDFKLNIGASANNLPFHSRWYKIDCV